MGILMKWVSQNTKSADTVKIRYLANNTADEIILLGSSRTYHHYVSSILADSIKMSVYNGGMDGTDNIYIHYFLLELILKHHSPKIVCLELSTRDYSTIYEPYKAIGRIAPYIGKTENADSIFHDSGYYWPYRLCKMYRYNENALPNIAYLFLNAKQKEDAGYEALPQSMSFTENLKSEYAVKKIDKLKLHYLNKFISLCKERNIKLVFTISPKYTLASSNLYNPLKKIADKNNIPFFDYHTKRLLLNHKQYFKDTDHLCGKGAVVLTAIFAHDLKEYLNKEGMVK